MAMKASPALSLDDAKKRIAQGFVAMRSSTDIRMIREMAESLSPMVASIDDSTGYATLHFTLSLAAAELKHGDATQGSELVQQALAIGEEFDEKENSTRGRLMVFQALSDEELLYQCVEVADIIVRQVEREEKVSEDLVNLLRTIGMRLSEFHLTSESRRVILVAVAMARQLEYYDSMPMLLRVLAWREMGLGLLESALELTEE